MLDVEKWAKTHLKTHSDYSCKVRILGAPFGTRPAAEITPQELDNYLSEQCNMEDEKDQWSAATANRYKAFISMVYREGARNGKVSVNPARLVRPRRENSSRERFLSRKEFEKLQRIVRRDNPDQAPSLIVAAYSAMRWSEQFTLTWSQVDIKRKMLVGVHTKTTSIKARYRDVPLNSITIAALKEQTKIDGPKTKPSDIVFPKNGDYADWDWWLKPALKEAKIEKRRMAQPEAHMP